jgi:hypothetical protein
LLLWEIRQELVKDGIFGKMDQGRVPALLSLWYADRGPGIYLRHRSPQPAPLQRKRTSAGLRGGLGGFMRLDIDGAKKQSG